jgi:hypothetical protein
LALFLVGQIYDLSAPVEEPHSGASKTEHERCCSLR